jgi:hypothetical protein
MSTRANRRDIEETLLEKAAKDAGYRKALLSDPRGAVEKVLGVSLPAGISVKVLEESADTLYLVLPQQADASGELSDAQLEAVAGGKPTVGATCRGSGCGDAAITTIANCSLAGAQS